MSSNGLAVMQCLPISRLDPFEVGLAILGQTEFAWDHLFREVAIANKQRDNKRARTVDAAQHPTDGRFFLPKAFEYLTEQASGAQGVAVEIGRSCGVRIQCGAMSHQNQRCIGEVVRRHAVEHRIPLSTGNSVSHIEAAWP